MTIIELMVVIAIVTVVAALAIPSFSGNSANAWLRDASLDVSSALGHARSEAIRTGEVHIVFVQIDADGLGLQNSNGDDVSILILNDGRLASANQNCKVDAGETVVTIDEWRNIDNGVVTGTPRAPTDLGTGAIASGSSFRTPGGAAASWVLFRPEGSPHSFDSTCTIGGVGSGAGAFYISNDTRTSAVVMMPMGGTRSHTNAGQGWTQ